MARILAIDYGTKRIGIAVTDPLQIIATPLTTVAAKDILTYLTEYFHTEEVEQIVVGDPRNMDNTASQVAPMVNDFVKKFKKLFPSIPIRRIDERFTSKIAKQSILMSGKKKKDRRRKELVDEVSATIILQSFLESQSP